MELAAIPVFIHIRARIIDFLLEELGIEGASEAQTQYFIELCAAYWNAATLTELLEDASSLLPFLEFQVLRKLANQAN